MTDPPYIEGTAEIVPYEPHELTATPLFGTDDPAEIVVKATAVANALADVIRAKKLFAHIQGKDHVLVEGWQLLGSMLGVTAVCVATEPIEDGFKATVEARTTDGRVIGRADAVCTKTEKRGPWKSADDYARLSMAQTRATSKALKGPLGFIVSLAGYATTPAEEMTFAVEDAPLARSKPSSDVSQPYVGDSDHEPPNVDRGGRIVDPELPQRPELVDAAKGLLLPAVQSCYTIAGLTPPERKRDAFRGLDDVQAETLESVLRNRRLQDAYPSDLGYTVDDLAPALKGDVDADADDLPWNEPSGSTSGDPVDRATVDPGVDPGERAPLLPLVAGDAPIDSVLSESDVALAERILAESFGGVVEDGPSK